MLFTSHALAAVRRPLRASVCRGALGLALLSALSSSALAQTFYVDNSVPCPAVPDGSELAPYCTINSAQSAHHGPGVTILVKPGIYREQVTVNFSGAAGTPFVFRATGPGVILEGADDFANAALWVQSDGTSWLAASVTAAPVQVFADGARLTPTTALPASMPTGSFRWVTGQGLYVNLGGDSPALHQALVGKRQHGFNIFNKTYVTVEGFQIQHPEQRGVFMQNTTSNLVIANNTVLFAGSYGIQTINGQNNLITGNRVSDGAFHGIGLTAGSANCVVSHNECFRNAHPTIRQANGIFLSAAPNNTLFGNNAHHNQDTGIYWSAASNNCLSYHNRSWANGDHGFDHLGTSGVAHVNDVAHANLIDGFSYEGNSPGGSVFNCIGTDNGIGMNPNTNAPADGTNLWVDAASAVGFSSDHNVWWNSTVQPPVKWISTSYATLAEYQTVSGQDMHSKQADPLFVSGGTGDFTLGTGSSAIDGAHSGLANWPATDLLGTARVDDFRVVDTGQGPVTFADMGVFEHIPVDGAPVVVSPNNINTVRGAVVVFTVTASDPDGDPINSLTVNTSKLPAGSLATFITNAEQTSGVFTWALGLAPTGNYRVTFIGANSLADTSGTNIHVRKFLTAKQLGEEGIAGGELALSNGYPNPSAGDVDFALDLPEGSDVDWSVFDTQGRRVYSESRYMVAGQHRLRWDGMTMSRKRVGTGIYFLRARVGGTEFVRRVVRF